MKNLINYLSKKSLSLGNGSGMTRKWLGNDAGMTRFSLASLICLCMLTLGVGNAWGYKMTYTFNTLSWGTTGQGDWTSGADGNSFTANQGVQITTGKSGANATSPRSFTSITKIEVQYCTNTSSGVGAVKVQVGSGTEKSFSVTKPSSGGTTLKTATFNFSPAETGSVKVTGTCTTNSVFIYSVAITYSTEVSGEEYTLLTDPSDLSIGDTIVIVESKDNYALSTTQNTNNRGQTKEGWCFTSPTTIRVSSATYIQKLILGQSNSHWTFYTGSGYLYAASSSSNHLKTQATNNANGEWTISIGGSSPYNATITAQGTNTHNIIQYNALFSCYASSNLQQPVRVFWHPRPKNVTWVVNEEETTAGSPTTKVKSGEKVTTLPTAPTSSDCDNSKVFMGWSASEIDGEDDDAPDDLFTTADGAPTVDDDVTYYAVFATSNGSGGTEYVLTDADDLTAGTYVIASYNTSTSKYVALTGGITTSKGNSDLTNETTGFTISDSKFTTLPTGACEFTLTGNTSDGFTIQNGSSEYLGYTDYSTNRKLAFSDDYSSYTWKADDLTYSGYPDGCYIERGISNNYKISTNSDNTATQVRGYSSSAFKPIYFFKKGSSTSYSAYATTCSASCETDPTIGDASNSAVTSATATVSCSDGIDIGDCDITEYGFYYGTTSGVTTSNATKHKVSDDGDSPFDDDVSSFSWNMTSLDANTHYYVAAYAVVNGVTYMGDETDFTTCKADAPNHVDITPTAEAGNYGYRYTKGETIKLTAKAYASAGTSSEIAAANITGWQWQKYVGSEWVNLTNGTTDGVTISGATTANLAISNCKSTNTGSYACLISTGETCSTASDGYRVRVYTLNGAYYGSGDAENAIIWTGENTGTVTLSLDESATYMFKVTDNDGKWYGREANNFIIEPWQQDCNTGNEKIRLFTGPAGNYTFTIDITNAQAGTPVVNVKVEYPEVTHPASGYMYVPKWWTCYPHWWDGSGNALTSDGSDPAITKYTEICDEDYWYMPVLDNYVNIAVKDNATWASASNNSGNQTTTDHSGMYLTHDGSWGWHDFATYTISFAAGTGGSGTMSSITSIACGASQTLPANSFEKTGYSFDAWHANVDVTVNGSTIDAGDDISTGATIEDIRTNITLTAQWAPNSYAIIYKDQGGGDYSGNKTAGRPTGLPGTHTYGSATDVSTDGSKSGYTFGGWYLEEDCSGDEVTSLGATSFNEDITLYAKWTAKKNYYVDRMHGNWDGEHTVTIGGKAYNCYLREGAGYTVPEISDNSTGENSCVTGHAHFVGWTTSSNFNAQGEYTSGKIYVNGETNTANADGTIYYAVWAEE